MNDVMITIQANFCTIGNVGNTDGKNIGGVEITIPPKATKRVNQLLAMEPSIHLPLIHAPKTLQVSNNECHGQQHPQHNIDNTLYTTTTNDKDVGMYRITQHSGCKYEYNIVPFNTYLE